MNEPSSAQSEIMDPAAPRGVQQIVTLIIKDGKVVPALHPGVAPETALIVIMKAQQHMLDGFNFGEEKKVVGVRGTLPPPPPQLVR